MLFNVHAIRGCASAPTAQHQRRPRTADDRAGKHTRQFIGALVEHVRHLSDPFLHLVTWHGRNASNSTSLVNQTRAGAASTGRGS